MIAGSLYAGVGGLDLGLARAGWRMSWQVERDPVRRNVLAQRFPDAQRSVFDVAAASAVERLGPVDLIVADPPSHDPQWYTPVWRIVARLRPQFLAFRAGWRCAGEFRVAFTRLGYFGVGLLVELEERESPEGRVRRHASTLTLASAGGPDERLRALLAREGTSVRWPGSFEEPRTLAEAAETFAGFPRGWTCACDPSRSPCPEPIGPRLAMINEAAPPAIGFWMGRELAALFAPAEAAIACPV